MKTLYFVESIYIPVGQKTASVTLMDANGEDDGIVVEVPTKNLVLEGYKRKKVQEGDYAFYDNESQTFSDGNQTETAQDANITWLQLQQEMIASGHVIDPHTGKPDYSGLLPEFQYLRK